MKGLAPLILLIVVIDSSQGADDTTCDKDWFGPYCEFQCHCQAVQSGSTDGRQCLKDGECPNDCKKPWFGPACQFFDMVSLSSHNAFSEKGCLAGAAHHSESSSLPALVLRWETGFHFTWLKAKVPPAAVESAKTPMIQFRDEQGQLQLCHNKTTVPAENNTVLYINCDIPVNIVEIHMSRAPMCFIQVSGGRNVALKQVIQNQEATALVDGVIDHTSKEKCVNISNNNPVVIILARAQTIYRVDLFYDFSGFSSTITNGNSSDMQGTVIVKRSSLSPSTLLINVTVQEEMSSDDYCVVQLDDAADHVNTLEIRILGTPIARWCEIKVFGDSSCEPGSYGLHCDQTCNCMDGTPCLPSLGHCPEGCKPGYMGPSCAQGCPQGYYGECLSRCNSNCTNSSCDRVTGECQIKCPVGGKDRQCETAVKITLEETSPNPFPLCAGSNATITVNCIAPYPLFLFLVNEKSQSNSFEGGENTTAANQFRKTFSFRPEKGENVTVTCRAWDNRTGVEVMQDSLIITVLEIVNSPPVIKVNEQIFQDVKMHNNIFVLENTRVTVVCEVDEGYPPVARLELHCGHHESSSKSGLRTSLEFVAHRHEGPRHCLCIAHHGSQCKQNIFNMVIILIKEYIKRVIIDLTPSYPSDVFPLCPVRNRKSITVLCTVPIPDVYPDPVFDIAINDHRHGWKPGRTQRDMYLFNSTFVPSVPGTINVSCLAESSSKTSHPVKKTRSIEIVEFPVMSAPIIEIDGQAVNVTEVGGVAVEAGTHNITCRGDGDTRFVLAVNLSCGGVTALSETASSTLKGAVNDNQPTLQCDCSLVTTCLPPETLNASALLTRSTASSASHSDTGRAVGIAFGIILFIACMLAMPYIWKQLQARRQKTLVEMTRRSSGFTNPLFGSETIPEP